MEEASKAQKKLGKGNKLFLIDPGHGGLNPNGEYVTAGKRSPKLPDGSQLYEGVNNRINAQLIVNALNGCGLRAKLLVDTWHDVSLRKRVEDANYLAMSDDVVLISIHSDAFGSGWTDPKGITTFHADSASAQSKEIAKCIHGHLWDNFEGVTLNRKVKSAPFYIIERTSMPAILLELGFHTNLDEVKMMQTTAWRDRIVKSLTAACLEIDNF